jgi:6-phosphogluconolactonase
VALVDVLHPAAYADAVGARLVTRLVDLLAASGTARVALSPAPAVLAVLDAVSGPAVRAAVAWRDVSVWWTDASPGSPGDDALEAVLGQLGTRQHRPTDGRPGRAPDLYGIAESYAAALAAAALPEDHAGVPSFDLVLVAVAEDGGVGALRPESPALHDERTVVVAPGAIPRVGLQRDALATGDEVWVLGQGSAVAPAVRLALAGAGSMAVPAAGVRGRARTRWLLDRDAARELPPQLDRIASP